MTLHRRQLPIASPCQQFEGREATESAAAFCSRCDKSVHDLSRLTEREIITLLARDRDGRICVSYRARPDGSIATRSPPPRFGPAALVMSLAGCAGHLAEADGSARDCVDSAGYHVECPPTSRLGLAVIPDAATTPPIDHDDVDDEPIDVPVDVPVAEGIAEDLDGLDFTRGLVSTPSVQPVEPAPTYPDATREVHGVAETELMGEIESPGAGKRRHVDDGLARRVQREARRIERRERRDRAREARRLARG